MGDVIWAAAFRADQRLPAVILRKRRLRLIDGRLAAFAVAAIGLASILALAGTAFAVRAMVVLCFAALAGRDRRLGSTL